MICPNAYWLVKPFEGIIKKETNKLIPIDGFSLIRTLFSGVSPGTERLVASGRVPEDCFERMACRYMGGTFRFPLKYGYSLVGQSLESGEADSYFFTMHPHQDYALVPVDHTYRIPLSLPPHRAVLFPNMETALNAVWDSGLSSDSSVAVVGGGIVGLLTAYVVFKKYGVKAIVFESEKKRLKQADGLSWVLNAIYPYEKQKVEFTHVFHTSATSSGLQFALDNLGFEGVLIELSWYGTEKVTVSLGGSFHYDRKRIISSNVSTISENYRNQFTYSQRAEEVFKLLDDKKLDVLLGEGVNFRELPDFMKVLYAGNRIEFNPLVVY